LEYEAEGHFAMEQHEVISAFLDNEPFEPQALVDALADPVGRGLLIDMIALRSITQPDAVLVAKAASRARAPFVARFAIAAAILAAAVVTGYQFGRRPNGDAGAAPAPTQVVKTTEWQEVPLSAQ
jgi:negative regulator of sigma E activity